MNHKKMMEFFLLSRIRILTETSLAVKAGMKFTEFFSNYFNSHYAQTEKSLKVLEIITNSLIVSFNVSK